MVEANIRVCEFEISNPGTMIYMTGDRHDNVSECVRGPCIFEGAETINFIRRCCD